MKKILLVLAAGITIASCNEADKKAETTSTTTAPTTNEAVTNTTSTNTAANTPQTATVDPASLTTIQWLDGSDKDFGKIEEGENLNVTFRFKNTGTKPLVISNVTAGCGCTVPETPKKPYAPGETGEIKASFNSTNKVGANSKQVNVFANTDPSMTTLVFRVDVKAKKS